MPQVYSDIPRPQIIETLRKAGYGIDSKRGYAFRLCMRSKVHIRKSTGLGEFVPVGGPSEEQMLEIERNARDVNDAARMVVAISMGKVQEVRELTNTGPAADSQSILSAVENRIDSKLNFALDPIREQLAAIAKALIGQTEPKIQVQGPVSDFDESAMLPPLVDTKIPEVAAVPKKKGGWPKGKPRKPKVAE